MFKRFFLLVAIVVCYQVSFSQTASDVLEKGIRIKEGKRLVLQFNEGKLKYDIVKSFSDIQSPIDFIDLEDSIIFLPNRNQLNIFIRPLNPLSHSFNSDNKIIIDPINEAAATSLSTILGVLKTAMPSDIDAPDKAGQKNDTVILVKPCGQFQSLQKQLEDLQSKLTDDKKKAITDEFKKLQSIDFLSEGGTTKNLLRSDSVILLVEKHFTEIEKLLQETKKNIEGYSCSAPEPFIAKHVFNTVLKDLTSIKDEQKKRVNNLRTAYSLVQKARDDARGEGQPGLEWSVKLKEAPVKEGKISVYTITINQSGYTLSDKEEIVSVESKEISKRLFMVRKFQLFVPEVSVGTAFTFFKYNTYGTTSDSTGQQFVAEPTQNMVRNINLTTMLNFNMFWPNSAVHPLLQIGAGINAGIPTLLVGGGLRFNNNASNRIRVTGGIAMTWIKELDKLKPGDKISGTADIENDLKYQFTWPPKPYIGIQYNF